MAKMKIVIACGTGIVCSSIIRVNVERILIDMALSADIEQAAVRDLPEDLSQYDCLILAMPIEREINIPYIIVNEYLSGITEECDKRVIDLLKSIS